MDQEPINVMLADDHSIVMEGFQRVLEPYNIRVIAKTSDPTAVISTYEANKPQVLLLDVVFGHGHSGLEILEKLLIKRPDAKVVILSQSDHFETIKSAFRLGVTGYLTKDCDAIELAKGVRMAANGQKYCTEKIGAALASGITFADEKPAPQLTPLELKIMRLIAEGLTLEEIGEHFGKYKRWAGRQVTKLKEQFGVERNAELVRIAVKLGIIDS